MNAPAAPLRLAVGYVRARKAVPVTVSPPHDDEGQPHRFRGRCLGAMYVQGRPHHYRVEDGDGVLFLVPPEWIEGAPPVLVWRAEPVRAGADA